MRKFNGNANVGLRHNQTGEIIAVYPHMVNPQDKDIESKVKFWYYQQGCWAEEELKNCYVDIITDSELSKYNF